MTPHKNSDWMVWDSDIQLQGIMSYEEALKDYSGLCEEQRENVIRDGKFSENLNERVILAQVTSQFFSIRTGENSAGWNGYSREPQLMDHDDIDKYTWLVWNHLDQVSVVGVYSLALETYKRQIDEIVDIVERNGEFSIDLDERVVLARVSRALYPVQTDSSVEWKETVTEF